MPCFLIPIHESNDCHAPAGPGGGQFCATGGRMAPLHTSHVVAALKAAGRQTQIRTRRERRAGYKLRQWNPRTVMLHVESHDNWQQAEEDYARILTAAGFEVTRPDPDSRGVWRVRRPLRESNDCHAPGGTPEGGQFCSTRGSVPGLMVYPRPEGSKDIPDFLKQDVLNAARAGIVVRHHQQPEPVQDIAGVITDPLALSHAQRGEETFFSGKGNYTPLKGPRGQVRIVTRGGEFEPTYETWGSYGPSGRKTKPLTPEMLPAELRATVHDVQSTFRHEVGHIMDDKTWPKAGAKYDINLQREVRAWTYAVEISPDHTVSERMVLGGLMSHAYSSFRKAEMLADESNTYVRRQGFMDQRETLERMVQNESKTGVVSIEAHRKAVAFANRVVKALANYGKVLRKKGIVRVPQAKDPWFPNADKRRLLQPGPGQHAWPGLL